MMILLIFCFVVFKYDPKRKIVRSGKMLVTYCLCIAIFLQTSFIYIANLHFKSLATDIDRGSEVTKMIHMLESWYLEICYVIVVINAIFNRKKQGKLLNEILQIEIICNKLKYQNHVSKTYKNLKWMSIAFVTGTFTFIFLIFTVFFKGFYYDDITTMITVTLDLLLTFFYNLILLLMVFVVQMLHHLFRTLNLNIHHKIQEINNCITLFNLEELTNLLKIHCRLNRTIKMFSESFGISYLGLYIYNVGTLTTEFYLAYLIPQDYLEMNHLLFINYIVFNIIWCCPLVINFGLMTSACNNVKNDVEALMQMVNNIEMKDQKSEEVKEMVRDL